MYICPNIVYLGNVLYTCTHIFFKISSINNQSCKYILLEINKEMAFLFFESIPLTCSRYSLKTFRILITFIIKGRNTLHKGNGLCLHNGDKSLHLIPNMTSSLICFILSVSFCCIFYSTLAEN